MESRRRKPKRSSKSGVRQETAPQPNPIDRGSLPTLEAFLENEGQISIGSIGPIASAAVASDPHNMLAALIRRPGESLQQLLERLDAAVELALEHDHFTDEINPPPRG